MRLLVLKTHVWLAAVATVLLVKALPLRWVLRLLSPPRWLRPYRGVSAETMVEVVRRRLARPRHMRRRACLREGLLLFHFLCLAAREPEVHFSVFEPPAGSERLDAHCWVSLDGRTLSSPPSGSSVEMMRYRRFSLEAPMPCKPQ